MILSLFLVLLGLVLLCVLLGYFTDDEPYLTVGLFLFFLLSSLIIIPGNVEYRTGDSTNTTFSYTNSTLTSQQETTAYTYTAWDDSLSLRAGIILSILSAFGFILSIMNIRRHREEQS
jgi:hypothetical protein